EHLPVALRGVVARQPRDQRRYVARVEDVELALGRLLTHDRGGRRRGVHGEPRPRQRRDGVGRDAVLLHLLPDDDRHERDGGLGGAVVHLPDVAEQPRVGRRVDDAPVQHGALLLLLAPVFAGVAALKSATLSPLAIACPPFFLISATTSCAGVAVGWPVPSKWAPRSFTTILAPCCAMRSACSRPIPRPEPVMIATLPSSSIEGL